MNPYIHSASQQYFAFNIWSVESAKGILDAAAGMGYDVILQTSMKAFERLDRMEFRAFVGQYAEEQKIHAYLHLDHCGQIDAIQEAVRCGWDSVMLDASDKPLEENIRLTNEVCALAGADGLLVEAEVGHTGGVEDGAPAAESGVARIADVEKFIRSTSVDMLAAAVGTAHGSYQGAPKLHYHLLEEIRQISDIPLVIHGGSGLSDEVLLRLLSHNNVRKINISTDVKLAYRDGIVESLERGYLEKKGFDPLRVTGLAHDFLVRMAEEKLRLLRRK